MDNFAADGIFVDDTPERVFSALLNPADLEVWMDAEEVDVDPREGGPFRLRRADGVVLQGVISRMETGKLLEIANYYREEDGLRRGPMTLRATLEERHGGVWITLRQDGLDCAENGGEDWKNFAKRLRKELVSATVSFKRHVEGI